MEYRIDATIETITRQAAFTADVYMRAAVEHIDSLFGEGYSKNNPGLVGQFMETAAKDFDSSMRLICAQKIEDALNGVGWSIQQAVSND